MSKETMVKEVPLLDLNAQYDLIKDEIKEAVNKVLESQYFIMGPEVEELEKLIAGYCGVQHAISCASGSDALLLSLMALDVGPGDAVITTPFTFFATAGAISRVGATPVFIDIDPVSYNIDPEQIKLFLEGKHPLNKKLNIYQDSVKAIIPVHLYGQMADMDPIMDIANSYDVEVIEDAAQAIGSEYKEEKAGSIGSMGCFSFFPSKNLGAYGDAGLITTNDGAMAEKLSILRLHGANPKYHHSLVGINSRLDTMQAAILKVKLKHLDSWSEKRQEKAQNYNDLFEDHGLLSGNAEKGPKYFAPSGNGSIKSITIPKEQFGNQKNNGRHIYHQYVIRTAAREKIIKAFNKHNIGYSIYYPVPLHEQECFNYLNYNPSDCPISSSASKTTLALPIYPELTTSQQEFVVRKIQNALS